MEVWLDTINLQLIAKAQDLGILKGVTTNPSLLARSKNPLQTLEQILHTQSGPLTVQVVSKEAAAMVKQGKFFYQISNRIITKIPATEEGFKAIKELSRMHIPTMATVVFHARQALLAIAAGAQYVAPYLGGMLQEEPDAWNELENMAKIIDQYQFPSKILVASLQNLEQVDTCARMGLHGVTLKDHLFNALVRDDEMTLQREDSFIQEWNDASFTKSLFDPSYLMSQSKHPVKP